jgi:LmbE family N-acetylglucosaminyl deacetylase
LDDAVYSCANLLIAHRGSSVVTVFAGAPNVMHDGYNSASTGEPFALDAITVRREEDRVALDRVNATPIWLDFFESDYEDLRPDVRYADLIRDELTRVINDVRPASVIAPLGLIHPDHLAVSEACQALWSHDDVTWYVYMDLPYGMAHPRNMRKRLRTLRRVAALDEFDGLGGDHDIKHELVALYGSQYEATRQNYHKVFDEIQRFEERYWRVKPTTSSRLG